MCLFGIQHFTKELFGFYEKAHSELIRRTINEFDWIRALSNVSIDGKGCYITETRLNIIPNFVPHEGIVCDETEIHLGRIARLKN